MTVDSTQTIARYLSQMLSELHPMMVEALHLAAVPHWFSAELFAAMRQNDDGRNAGLIERLTRFSFVEVVTPATEGMPPIYAVREDERVILQRHWIAQDAQAYREAHRRALAFWETNADPNPFAQAQNVLYHMFFVDVNVAIEYLIARFRQYHDERQLAAIERLLQTVDEARYFLALLNEPRLDELAVLHTHLQARLAQLYGDWGKSKELLEGLLARVDEYPQLRPYVFRAYGLALAHTGQYVPAIEQYQLALRAFDQLLPVAIDADRIEAEKAHTRLALGDGYVGLANVLRGQVMDTAVSQDRWYWLRNTFSFFLSLPLVVYLTFFLGLRVWHPHFWPTLSYLDWIVARLFAVAARHYRQADKTLEARGERQEGGVADERQAHLFLSLGDAEQARKLFERLLSEEQILGPYRQAVIRLGLGQALVMTRAYEAAIPHLQTAVSTFTLYEDNTSLALAERTLAEAFVAQGQTAESLPHFTTAFNLFQEQDDLASATDVAERLAELVDKNVFSDDVAQMAQKTAESLQLRRYAFRYRHPATIWLQRFILVFLAFLVFLLPAATIKLEISTNVVPEIRFSATPLLRADDPDFTPSLSQGIAAVNVVPAPDNSVLLWLGLILLVGYILLSTGLGILAIIFTPLHQLQAATMAETVWLDQEGLFTGAGTEDSRRISWRDVTHLLRANVYFWNNLLIDNSGTAIVTPEERIELEGRLAWYLPVVRRVARNLPETAEKQNWSYHLLRSRMGTLYLLTIGLFGVISLFGTRASGLVYADIPGLRYSLADLYPYLYLGLFVPPMWWFVIRPLQIRSRIKPYTRLPWLLGSISLLLTLLRLFTGLRPWLTVPDIYPPLTILVLTIGAVWVLWQTRHVRTQKHVYSRPIRWLVLVAGTAVCLLALANLTRETVTYHFLVIGNSWQEHLLQTEEAIEREQQARQAIDAYTTALTVSDWRILGINGRQGFKVPLILPETQPTAWYAALNNRAAIYAQIGAYESALQDYNQLITYNHHLDQLYVRRALVYQGLGTQPGDEIGENMVMRSEYNAAIQDFNEAISRNPDNATYYLWRGVAYHALGNEDQAWADYDTALSLTGKQTLTPSQRAQALTGKGWIVYAQATRVGTTTQRRELYQQAAMLFREAVQNDPESDDALLGLGYATYSLRQYDDARNAWEKAAEINPNNASVAISLGTLYWRIGTLGNDYESSGEDRCADDSLSLSEKETAASWLERAIEQYNRAIAIPGQEDEDIAFSYRTRAQIQFLLRNCPGYDQAEVIADAIESYTRAINFDPDNALYYHFRGRLAYAEWLNLPAGTGPSAREWLFLGLADQQKAIELDPVDKGDYQPHRWLALTEREAIGGTLARGDQRFAAGEYEVALQYYELVAKNVPDNAEAAFKAGLTALALGDVAQARVWYEQGLAVVAQSSGGDAVLEEAIGQLDALLSERPELEANGRSILDMLNEAREQ
ncbi:MAG: tetratricopeptide repeat protein [Chloroflexi bacterium]|nr:MAG: tetratricopeptide repeat protein [Chloroflexota bacterium]